MKSIEFNELYYRRSSVYDGYVELLFINSTMSKSTVLWFDGIEFNSDSKYQLSVNKFENITHEICQDELPAKIISINEDDFGDFIVELDNSYIIKIISKLDFSQKISQQIYFNRR